MTDKRLYKVQCDSTGKKVLIYDETREHLWEGYLPKAVMKALRLRNMTKRYFYGTVNAQGKIELDPSVEVFETDAGF